MLYRRPSGMLIRRPSGGIAADVDCCCNVECLPCGNVDPGSYGNVLLTISPMVNGGGAEGFRCPECEEIFFTDQELTFTDVDGGACIYEYYYDPRPDPATTLITDESFNGQCAAWVVRVHVVNYYDFGGAKKTDLLVYIWGSCDSGGTITDECFLIGTWQLIGGDGWHGTYSVPSLYSSSDFCGPNATTPDAIVTLPCNTVPAP